MKLNKTSLLIFITLFLSGCLTEFVQKDDIDKPADSVKQDVMDMRDDSSITPEDYGSEDDNEKTLEPREVLKIPGKERGLKFDDESWESYPISVNLNVVPIRTFFKVLADLTGHNIIVGDEVNGDISIELRNVDWYEVMEMVLKEENLIHDVNATGNVITVHTHEWVEKQSQSFDTALTAKIKVINSLATLETKTTAIYKINYAQPETLAKQLDDVVKSLAAGAESDSGDTASFVVDQRSNSLIVQATASDMIWIKETIDSLDRPTKQVKVEVFIVEATDNFAEELGSRVGIFNSDKIGNDTFTTAGTLGGATPTAAGTITTATTGGSVSNNPIANPAGAIAGVLSGGSFDLRVELQAMQTENLIKIVSNPKLFIVDNEEAVIEDGEEVPYNTVAQAGSTPTTEFKTAALTLKVTPQIIDDGNIYLDVAVNKDSVIRTSTPPSINTKQLKTKLLIKDGGVALIGGITKTSQSNSGQGVPFLQDLPGIGVLFKSNENSNNKDTLFIFIAPEVI